MRQVVLRFADPACSFLRAPTGDGLDDEAVIDIGHEALIRRWQSLDGEQSWVREEERDADRLRELLTLASARGTIPEAKLKDYETWWAQRRPTSTWARRYVRGEKDRLKDAADILAHSRERVRLEAEHARRERMQQRRRRFAMGTLFMCVIGLVGFGLFYLREQVEKERRDAVEAQSQAHWHEPDCCQRQDGIA